MKKFSLAGKPGTGPSVTSHAESKSNGQRGFGLLGVIAVIAFFQIVTTGEVKESFARSPVWKVQKEANRVYLLGSVHLLKKEDYPLPEPLEKAFADSQKLVEEVNLDELEDPATQQMILAKGLNKDNKTLRQLLSSDTYEFARKQVEAMGLDLKEFERFKPWMLDLTLTALALERLGFEPKYGIDQYFFDKAKRERKEVLSLETVEYQLDRFDGMSPKMQETILLQSLKEIDTVGKDFAEIIRAWRGGDTKVLESTLLENFREFPEVYSQLVVERNTNWMPRIESFLQQKENYLVVVGAGHLLGKDGLLALLKAKGYGVEQL